VFLLTKTVQEFFLDGFFMESVQGFILNLTENLYNTKLNLSFKFRIQLSRSFFSSAGQYPEDIGPAKRDGTNQKMPRLYPVLPKLASLRLNGLNSLRSNK